MAQIVVLYCIVTQIITIIRETF